MSAWNGTMRSPATTGDTPVSGLTRADRIVSITWKREIKPKEFALFTFTAHNPGSGTLRWNAHQTFADGSMRHWTGERGTPDPASVTTIVAKGAPAAAPAADPGHKHEEAK